MLRKFRKKPQLSEVQRKEMLDVMRSEAEKYVSKEFLKQYLEDIEKDERKKRLWNSLSQRTKLKVLRHHYAKNEVKK